MTDAHGRPDVDPAELGELFTRVHRRLRRATMAALEPTGVSPHQSRALRTILRESPLRPSQLADELGIALRSATQVVDDLVQLGMVSRSPDPQDRRAVLLSPTQQGLDTAARIADLRHEQARIFLGWLDTADRAELERILLLLEQHRPEPATD